MWCSGWIAMWYSLMNNSACCLWCFRVGSDACARSVYREEEAPLPSWSLLRHLSSGLSGRWALEAPTCSDWRSILPPPGYGVNSQTRQTPATEITCFHWSTDLNFGGEWKRECTFFSHLSNCKRKTWCVSQRVEPRIIMRQTNRQRNCLSLIWLKLLVSQASPLIYLVLLNIGKLFFIIGVPRRDSTRKSQTVGVGYTFYEGK